MKYIFNCYTISANFMLKMLQTKCKSNALDAQENIVKQLEELNIWQEQQKRLLEERQNMQRKMLGLEHQNMYDKMGLFHARAIIEGNGVGDEKSLSDLVKKGGNHDKIVFDREVKEIETRLFEGSKKIEVKISNETDNENVYCNNEGLQIKDVKIKRPYLKRGEGIKARYKISPESLRLNNLPRYKYATNHPKIKNLQRRRASKVKPSLEIGNLITKTSESVEKLKLDINEKYFHQMLVNSNNVNSSTPDTKFSKAVTPSISNFNLRNVRVDNSKTMEGKKYNNIEENLHEHKVGHYAGISWAKFLDPKIVEPIPIQEIRTPDKKCDKVIKIDKNFTEDDENLTIFELLEKQAAKGAIDMNSTCVRKFLESKNSSEERQESEAEFPTEEMYTGSRLRPTVEEILRSDSDDESTVSVESIDESALRCQTPTISSYVSDELKNKHILNVGKTDLRIRFTEENTTRECDNGQDISNNSALYDEATSDKSSHLFHQFKDALFSALLGKTDGEDKTTEQNLMMSSPPSTLTQELQEKSNIIKLRLEELEKEIVAFRNNNLELIRAKQEYEMEKAHFNQERNEVLNRLRDDKIQMEMYLHDERMKIEEEKRKFEQQMRVLKQTLHNKERKEILRLKDELESLHIQLKQKEQLHASAQARLRVQIRNMERDQKHLYEDVERLTKENKRLQSEKEKLEREGNNKMLMEINRNIAKLAPKLAAGNSGSTTINCPEVNTRFSKRSLKSSYSSQTNKKSSNNNQSQVKAPPNTRNTSRTDLKEDVENTSSLYKANIFDSCNDSEDALAGEDDDDDIIAELKVTQNCKSVKSAESSSHSNISKDTVIYKCDTNNSRFVVPSSKSYDENTTKESNDKKNAKSITKCGENFRREIINADGSKDILYPNGNLKKISPDGMNIRMLYFNKDIKETNVNEGTVKYYYAETNTWHTTYLDGLEIFEFPNGQTEHRYKNGVIEIHLPDNSVKVTNPTDKDKLEEWRFADGTNLIQMRNGDRVLMLPNGQKEIHTKLNKRREYPDGTVKLVYPDGSQETRYSNGRIRLKDKDGNLVMDTERV